MKKPSQKSKPTEQPTNSKIIKHDLSAEQKQEIKDAFDMIDTDGSGSIEVEELKIAMKALGFDTRKEETKKIIENLDKNKDGVISYEEFLDLLTTKLNDKDHIEEMRKIHSNIADEKTGAIDFDTLKALCKDLGEIITDDEIREMIEEADYDRDGEVNDLDFINLMKKINILNN